MSKKIIFLLVVLFLFSRSHLVFASPIINELMYDLDGADIDWVEIYNPDSADVDLTSLKLLISNSISNHGITKHSGSEILHKGDFGIIVPSSDILDYVNKWGSSGNIFTASFSLPNETEKVEINNGDKNIPLSSVTYNSTQGASGDGNSLQLISGVWKAALPTPGTTNNISISSTLVNPSTSGSFNNEISSVQTTTTSVIKNKITEEPKIKTKIITKNLVFAGLPIEFQAKSLGYSGETLSSGKYFWNFGDGSSKEATGTDKFTHTYFYSGEYIVSLEYYQNIYVTDPIAVDKITIKAVPVQISISRVGDDKDFFVELTNDSLYEMDISGWILSSENKKFIFPKNSIILPKRIVELSSKVTQFTVNDAKNLKLFTPTGEVVYDYGISLVPDEIVVKNEVPTPIVIPVIAPVKVFSEKLETNKNTTKIISTPEINIPAENLSSSVIESDIIPNSKNSYLTIISLFVFLGLSAVSVYFIRRNRLVPEADDDFEILDE